MIRLSGIVLVALAWSQVTASGQSILGTNLIANPGAEAGPATTRTNLPVASIPGWSQAGSAGVTVLTYNLTGYVQLTDPTPPDHGAQYFAGHSSISQDIDVSAGAALISAGNITFAASAYIGNSGNSTAKVIFGFENAAGQLISSVTLGPTSTFPFTGLLLQRQIGLVPTNTRKVNVTITFVNDAFADSLSLVFNSPGSAASVFGANLITNGDAESGPSAATSAVTTDVPGWSRHGYRDIGNNSSAGFSTAAYGAPNSLASSAPGPPNPGANFFYAPIISASANAGAYQDIDVSAASTQIDSGLVQWQLSAWLGGLSTAVDNAASLSCQFFDWSGKQLSAASTLTVEYADRNKTAGLVNRTAFGNLPTGTRRIHLEINLDQRDAADSLSLVLAAPTPPGVPAIKAGGIVSSSSFGQFSFLSPGSWLEIYGSNLANSVRGWALTDFVNGVGPTSLDGVSVLIGGKPAFVEYVSPTQINAQVPSDAPLGFTQITVKTADGVSDPYTISINPTAAGILAPPAFLINGTQYAAALFPDALTFVIPTGAIAGVPSRPAKPGDTITLYGVGFGPVNPDTPAGTLPTTLNSLSASLIVTVGNVPAVTTYDGLVPGFPGLYQINLVVSNVPDSDAVPIAFTLGGTPGGQKLSIAVHQ